MNNKQALVVAVRADEQRPRGAEVGPDVLAVLNAAGARPIYSVLYYGAGRRELAAGRPASNVLRLRSSSTEVTFYSYPQSERAWMVVKPGREALEEVATALDQAQAAEQRSLSTEEAAELLRRLLH